MFYYGPCACNKKWLIDWLIDWFTITMRPIRSDRLYVNRACTSSLHACINRPVIMLIHSEQPAQQKSSSYKCFSLCENSQVTKIFLSWSLASAGKLSFNWVNGEGVANYSCQTQSTQFVIVHGSYRSTTRAATIRHSVSSIKKTNVQVTVRVHCPRANWLCIRSNG